MNPSARLIARRNGHAPGTAVEPLLEILVTEDRKIQITALDDDDKPAKIADQSVQLTGDSRSKPTRMTFTKDGDTLLSDLALPAGNKFPVILHIKPTTDAKTVLEKFILNLDDCPSCDFKEYACTCAH